MGGLSSLSRKKITVCVEHPATKKTHQETVPGDLTVWELKKKISKIFKIQAENQILAADQGRIMANDKTLADYDMKDGSTIIMMQGLP